MLGDTAIILLYYDIYDNGILPISYATRSIWYTYIVF